MKNPKKESILIGALLHDIGKIIYREGSEKQKSHEILGYEFLKEKVKMDNNYILECVKYHHERDKNYKEYIEKLYSDGKYHVLITILADHLSSTEREKKEDNKINELVNIFSNISFDKENSNNLKYIEENYSKKYTYGSIPTDYSKIKKDLEEYLKKDNNIEKLINIYFKNTFFVPSAEYKSIPDVSLWDHSKTTCAIACCLYNLYQNNEIKIDDIKNAILNKKKFKESWFSLIHGDLSGIQKFIFDIKTKGALKQLKGRSFLLDFLTEVYARYIIDELKLCLANILYVGGGHFYILSHKIDSNQLEEISKKINEKLFNKFHGKIFLALGKEDLSVADFVDNKISEKWAEISKKTSSKKSKKFYDIDYNLLFDPKDEKLERCKICGNLCHNVKKSDEFEGNVCELCVQLSKLTKKIKGFYENSKTNKNGKINIKELEKLKLFSDLIPDNTKLTKLFPCIDYVFDFDKIVEFEENNSNKNGENTKEVKNINSILLYPLYVPTDDQNAKIKILELSELSGKSKGVKKIGILKGDVDNLGLIFKEGLKNASISRVSTLSTMFTLFFKYYVPKYIEKNYKESLYLVYSGGDDFLLVGAWDKVLKFAKELNDEFKEFVCGNKNIHMSMGLVITDPKHSFRNAVMLAEEYLEKAKDNDLREKKDDDEKNKETDPKHKNSITILSVPFNWDCEIVNDNVISFDKGDFKGEAYCLSLFDIKKDNTIKTNLVDFLVNIVEKSKKKRFLHVLKETSLRLDKAKRKGNYIDLGYYHRFVYYLNRNISDEQIREKMIHLLEKLLLHEGDEKYLLLLAVCSRVSELKLRRGEKDELSQDV